MKNEKLLNEWAQVNIALHTALEELDVLDRERELIGKKLEKTPLSDLKKEMTESTKRYEELLKLVKSLSARAKKIKSELE